ncbi:dipeptidyl carboxypeptidase II [Novosphingobium marinum]|uniref:Dipeptidyl carboxypeptidase n=1 Tax=Novosphingobium marinum TaxID=1514948 RepID=A0A7Y9XYK7_9SPHN|nr:M3 family metallopeptidase [Novosphingobium marinum]NYH95356.1 peptidyl-dipeptidase Dcp [Novosphingobium marinum]GGC26377.1 dipeptidyl carboxypeptidase II [Novosphingobium marinum]
MKTRLKAAAAPAVLGAAMLAGCTTMPDTPPPPMAGAPATADIPQGTGYFAQPSSLPFQAPDFTQIDDADYGPAFEQAMEIHNAEVQAIIDNPSPPTFSNTIVALEKSGRMLGRVATVFYALTGANTNDTLDAIDAEVSPRLSAHFDGITLNPALFQRVKAVYDNRAAMAMTPEDAKLLEETYDQMVHAGAMLTETQKDEVKQINTRLSTITTEFSQKLTEATKQNALVVDSRDALAGLSDAEIEAAAKAATERGMPGKYVIALQNTTQQPLLSTLQDRDTREALFAKSWSRAEQGGDTDTRALIAEIAALRARKAAIFGQPDWATYQMWDRMAENPTTALGFMQRMVPALAATQRREAAMLNEAIADEGKNFEVRPWDWQMYADKVKKARYDFDPDAVKPYFEVRTVLEDGIFHAANQLYGLSFSRRDDLPVYHPDVWTYTVFDRDGSELGVFYFDPFQRDNKRGGAWMSNFVDQNRLFGTKPVIYNVLNIPKAPEGEPQLVSWDNVETMFHEFGHALHGFFADQTYPSLSGTAVARDFVEYPSQVNEMWASDPQVLANYAKHHETGATIPTEMIDKIQEAARFNQGYELGEVVEAALLDMKWHALSAEEAAAIDTPAEVDAFEEKALKELGLEVSLVPPRYRSSYFRHIFSNPAGYSAGYYSYLWTEMLDRDSRDWFRENGGLTRENGDHFRATVLSRGGTQDYFEMYKAFAGRDPRVEPMLEARGLIEGATATSGGDETGIR